VKLSRRRPPAVALAAPAASSAGRPAELVAAVRVEDQLEPRVRLPADILRCITACVEIALLVGLALLAKATASGVEEDLVFASRKLAIGFTRPLFFLASVALLVLPVVLAIRLILRDQLRRLVEAAVIGLVAVGVTIACDALLRLPALADLLRALGKQAGQGVGTPLDAYLAGLVAYITVIGLSGRPRWRAAFWLAIGFYCLASVASSTGGTSVLTLLITLLIGQAVGFGLRYAIGTKSERPTAAEIAGAISAIAAPVTEIRRIPDPGTDNRRYAALRRDGGMLDVTVFDRDQQLADAIYRLYRSLRLRSQVSRAYPLTVERAIERRALMTYAVKAAGVATPRLRALLRVGPEAAVMATDHQPGVTLADLPDTPTDRQLGQVFDAVMRLHQHRVTHRSLTADHILLTGAGSADGTGDGEVILLDPGDGDVAATDLQVRLDLAQLTAALALLVGPERAAAAARAKLGSAEVAALVGLLQPVVLHRSTRAAMRRRKDVLPALRKRLVGSAPGVQQPPEQLERIRPRTVITLVASIIAAYIVVGQFGRVSFAHVFKSSDWRWIVAALALSAVTYVGAAFSLSGFVLERLNLLRTLLAQLAGGFVTLVTPAAVGGVALNLRYLQKADVEPADAAASVGVSQVFAFSLHIVLLVIFAALTGTARHTSLRPPGWVYIALGVLGAAVLLVLSFPAGRRLAQSRIAPALGQVIPRLLDIAQKPAKLAEGLGGAFLLTSAYILCLAASVKAVGGHAALVSVAVVYLTGSALGSAVPTPGGLGAVEAALSAGLTAAGLPGATAVSAVLLFRLLTFWLPVPFGWAALSYLQRHDAL
jgi:glycosyltransferase 2 family protein